ncbi:glycosyltransferase family 4 protein [Geoalkalibacter sp.]|uniref:glycosyltransferase family 4 protein n=1 Tax=Geoalkalibacter sp. TaxID=3041440 RepID=UPI00272DFB18|nr:glycosyltransferase family 4 protein [Geoalkalibacter sp.]
MIEKFHLIVLGTDPSSRSGGIANALYGYFNALQQSELCFDFVATHHAYSSGGKYRHWLVSFFEIFKLLRKGRRAGKYVVAYIHVGGGIPSFVRKSILAFFIRILGAPVVMQLHGLEVATYMASLYWRLFFRIATGPANVLCVLTPWWKNLLDNSGIKKTIHIVPNPLDEEWEAIAQQPISRSSNKNEITVLSVARVEPGKGVDLLVEAIPYLPDFVKVVVAGDGALLQGINNRVVALGVERQVSFLGWVGLEEKLRLMREADIFCLPSSYDSFGMGFVEAMAHALPVVALDWGPIHDVVPDGKCGILIKKPDPKLLADAIARLAGDYELRAGFGKNGQAWVLEQFGSEVVGAKIRTVMEAIC